MIRATNHIGICVSDMEQCIPFYEGVLGLKRVYDDEMTGHFLDTVQGRENMHYRIVKFASPEGFIVELLQDFAHVCKPQTENCLQDGGLRHFAYEVADVDAAYQRVKAAGCATISEPCTSEDGSRRLFFVRDPELNLIELMQFFKP